MWQPSLTTVATAVLPIDCRNLALITKNLIITLEQTRIVFAFVKEANWHYSHFTV